MIFKRILVEKATNKKWYHVSRDEIRGKFRLTSQGIHLAQDISVCKGLVDVRGYSNPHYYEVRITIPTKPLFIDADLMMWDASNIATAIISKINNGTFEGASDGLSDDGTNYKEDNPHSLIKTTRFTQNDIRTLKSFTRGNGGSTESDFRKFADFLKSKGYNCIYYKNYSEVDNGVGSMILFSPDDCEIIKEIKI